MLRNACCAELEKNLLLWFLVRSVMNIVLMCPEKPQGWKWRGPQQCKCCTALLNIKTWSILGENAFHSSTYITVRTKDKNKRQEQKLLRQGKVEIPWLPTFSWLSSQTLISGLWFALKGIQCFIFKVFPLRTRQNLKTGHSKLDWPLHLKRKQSFLISHTHRIQTKVDLFSPLLHFLLSLSLHSQKFSKTMLIFDIEILPVNIHDEYPQSHVLPSAMFWFCLLTLLNLIICNSCF